MTGDHTVRSNLITRALDFVQRRGADMGTARGLTWPSRSGHLKRFLVPAEQSAKPHPFRRGPHYLGLLAGKSGRTEAP